MSLSLKAVEFDLSDNSVDSGLVPLSGIERPILSIDEEIALLEAQSIGDLDYVFFRRFADGRSSQVAAYVIDNSSEKLDEIALAHIHRNVWLNGTSPLLYVGWVTRVDILSCARGPDFWKENRSEYQYEPVTTIDLVDTAASVSRELQERRFSARRLSDGTFWDDPENSALADADEGAHQRLIEAVVEADESLQGRNRPVVRQLLLLTILIKYLEDRGVFAEEADWFDRFHKGATNFFNVLESGTPGELKELLSHLEAKFNGDIFCLPEAGAESLTSDDLRQVLTTLVEAKTLRQQRYLWDAYSFQYLPVEVLSHLYQRFAHHEQGAIYTPPFVASLLLDFALPYDQMTGHERVLDPTCGSGIFLVGAFRRLVNFWRSQHQWQQPDVATLKEILTRSLFGVELQEESLHLTSFSLALAVCDFLKPNVIWNELQFDRLEGTNLRQEDFFEFVERAATSPLFDVVIGNPPFLSSLTDVGKRVNEAAKITAEEREQDRGNLPDNQAAYLIAEQAMDLLGDQGRLCLIQPSGLLYNEKSRKFQRYLLSAHQVDYVLDFTSIRGLFKQATKVTQKSAKIQKKEDDSASHTADTKIVVLVARKASPSPHNKIRHLTFRRTISVEQRIGFELDHYDYHLVSQTQVLTAPFTWKVNMLGGGRLHALAERLSTMRTLGAYFKDQNWKAREGYIAGTTGVRDSASWLTGQKLSPSTALTGEEIDEEQLSTVEAELFAAPRTQAHYQAPLMLIRENERLQCGFWDEGFLAYKAQVIGISVPESQRKKLFHFYQEFGENRELLSAFCLLFGTRALVSKATSPNKIDIENIPWPENNAWDLAFWEQTLCDDLVNYMADYVRKGQNSVVLKNSVGDSDLERYSALFCTMLGSIYQNLRVGPSMRLNSLVCQTFYFGERPHLDWLARPEDWQESLHALVYVQSGEALRTARMVRIYDTNVILIVKPDRLRYWIASTAIRDADETFFDLTQQGG